MIAEQAPSLPQKLIPRRVTVLGSTGSIGRNTVDLLERYSDTFEIEEHLVLALKDDGTFNQFTWLCTENLRRIFEEFLHNSRIFLHCHNVDGTQGKE